MGGGWNLHFPLMAGLALPLTRVSGGYRLACRVTPKSSRNDIGGFYIASNGAVSLKAHITAAPEKGKANKALIKLLGKETGLAPSTMSVISGEQSRNKLILIEGEPSKLEETLTAWLGTYND